MENSKALHRLLESSDLIGMLEDLMEPKRIEALSPSSWAGMRITLRTLRDTIVDCHDDLARNFVRSATETKGNAQPAAEERAQTVPTIRTTQKTLVESSSESLRPSQPTKIAVASAQGGPQQSRDLKSALQRFVER